VTDDERRAIGNRWDAIKGGYKRLSFEEAHKDMRQVLGELWRTREALSQATLRIRNDELKYRDQRSEMLREIEHVIHKYR
jgi:hypothetical protein